MEFSNITIRKMRRSMSLRNISDNILDSTMTSLPNTSINDKSCCEELRTQVDQLTISLNSAQKEIVNLSNEILDLKNELREAMTVINSYKNKK